MARPAGHIFHTSHSNRQPTVAKTKYLEKLLLITTTILSKNAILPIKNKIGPSLAMLLNRKVASIDGFKYSKSFLAIDKNWSYENLFFFLKNPKSWAPGTKMSYRGISKEDDLINVLKYLSHVSKLNES